MEFPDIKIPILDMVIGVGELIVDEVKLVFHALTDRHKVSSDYGNTEPDIQ